MDLAEEVQQHQRIEQPHLDSWADEDGSIGKAYGYQMRQKHVYKEGEFDQVDRVLYDLKHNPVQPQDPDQHVHFPGPARDEPLSCAYSMTFNVTENRLNAILNQRSQDMLAANGWNVVQYAALVHMIAKVSGLEAGELVHVIADAHIYDRHIPIVKDLLEREQFDAPRLILDDPGEKGFYGFTPDHFHFENYQHGKGIGRLEVAI